MLDTFLLELADVPNGTNTVHRDTLMNYVTLTEEGVVQLVTWKKAKADDITPDPRFYVCR